MDSLCQQIANRNIRVFISSTFSDMQAERDELVKFVFPQLRSLCDSRGVVWGEVDLRWGITDEERAEGKVLPICLDEIKNCRPYFIGLLGERYGWIPEDFSPELIEREPWLTENLAYSVTELEILHGVLRNPAMSDHAFFYFRDPAYIKTLDTENSSIFREDMDQKELESLGVEEAERNLKERQYKLKFLKDKIRQSGFPTRENYPTPKALGEFVLADMTSLINRLFPEEDNLDPLDKEAADHQQFAERKTAVYIGKQDNYRRLDRHVEGDGPPLAVLGESGVGKSALLAAWALDYRKKHTNLCIITHFIGATSHSTDCMGMLRRVMGELRRHFDIQENIPNTREAIIHSFASWLQIAANHGKVVIILDALDLLENEDAAQDLVWIPEQLPPEIRIIVSTLSGSPLDEIKRRNWEAMTLLPLCTDDRSMLVSQQLKQYSKKLPVDLSNKIVSTAQTGSPLYLKTLVDELRIYGAHETLSAKIDDYLQSDSIVSLYNKILDRYERDYDRLRPNLVRDSLSLILSAHYGLSEYELLEILGTEGLPLPHSIWSPLSLAAKEMLTQASGLMSISHQYFSQTIINKYLATEDLKLKVHQKLADYFSNIELCQRKIDEFPYHLIKSGQLNRLHEFITDINVFSYLYDRDKYLLIRFWNRLLDEYDIVQSYSKYLKLSDPMFPDTVDSISIANKLGTFFFDLSLYSVSKTVFQNIITYNNQSEILDKDFISSVYNNLGAVYEIENDTQEAHSYYKSAIESSCQVTNKSIGVYFSNYALSCNKLGEHTEAEEYFFKAIDVLRLQYGSYNKYIATCLSSLSTLLLTRATSKSLTDEGIVGLGQEHSTGLLVKAESMAKEALHMKETHYGRRHPEIIGSINILADILRKQREYEKSEKLLFRALGISKLQPQSFRQNTMSSIDILVSLYLDSFDFSAAKSACQESFELKTFYYGLNDQRTIRAANKLSDIETLARDSKSEDITWAILDKTLGPLVEKNYMPIPFPFMKFIILIVSIYYLMKITIGGSSVIVSIVSAGLIIGAHSKITHKKDESDE